MHVKAERTLAGLTIGALLLVWFAVVLLAFYVPRLKALWEEASGELSPAKTTLLAIGSFTSQYFLGVAPLLLAATVAAIVWRLHTIRKVRATTTAS